MSWLNALSGLFGKADSTIDQGTDPWNYMLGQQLANRGLDNPARQPEALLAAAQAAFPTLTLAAGKDILQELDAVHHRAYDLGSAVNQAQLNEARARQQLRQEFPQLTQANLSRVLTQALVNTR